MKKVFYIFDKPNKPKQLNKISMIEIKKYQVRLEEDLEKVTASLKEIGVNNPVTDDWEEIVTPEVSDLTDSSLQADYSEELEERGGTLAVLETEYRDIKRALKKITDGTFGLCEIDQEPIEEERLNFKPTARTCLEHKDKESELEI